MNIISLNQATARTARARKPRIMVAGEFSAGKTQLINGLLGQEVLPSNVVSTSLPPVWLIGEGNAACRIALDGARHDLASIDDARLDGTHYLALSLDAPFLASFDIIDTPGNSDPNIPAEYWERMLDHADAVIWCTNATQAWRQSEKSAWKEMPERLRDNAVLLITHSDRMPDENAAAKVMRRVRRDVKEDFAAIMMASLIDPDHIAAIAQQLDVLFAGIEPAASDHPAMTDILREIRASASDRIAPRRIRNPFLPPDPEAADVLVLERPLPAEEVEPDTAALPAMDVDLPDPVAEATEAALDPEVAAETAPDGDADEAFAEAEDFAAPEDVDETAEMDADETIAEIAEEPEDEAAAEMAEDLFDAETEIEPLEMEAGAAVIDADLPESETAAAPEDAAPEEAVAEELETGDDAAEAMAEDDAAEAETAEAIEEAPEAQGATTAEADADPVAEAAPEDTAPEQAPEHDVFAFSLAGPHPVRSPYPGLARDTWNLICYGHDLSDTDTVFACLEATLREIDRSLAVHAPSEPEIEEQDGEAADNILRNVASAITASHGQA